MTAFFASHEALTPVIALLERAAPDQIRTLARLLERVTAETRDAHPLPGAP
ncbi:MAG: hypothetical protein NZ699_15925 [Roseiflexus sp.]|nr:hypothetical protein [Roseiflexus sp.]